MRKRLLGRSGVVVSEFGLGTMTFGQEADERAAVEILDHYVESGGNLIDTADVYPPVGPRGVSEEIIGRWLSRHSAPRDSIVLATKCRGRMDDSGNSEGLSRRWILRACEGSLRRLQTDYIDLYQAHQWDPATPIEESLAAFDMLVRSGKVRYIGVSNFTGWQLERTVMTARQTGLSALVSLQPQYNMLAREIEWELVPVCVEHGLSIIPWGPLGQGWLSGKYSRDAAPTGATRLGEDPNRGVEAYSRRNVERTWRIVDTVKAVASELGVPPARVALRWLADRPRVTAPLLGARARDQLRDNLMAAEVSLDKEQRARLDAVSEPPTPDYPYRLLAENAAARQSLL
ncbi:MAG TPA: aldo/keto reductase [Candidatus Dormibacteraeota bacterium]|jgi:aryl-alcohol dehydrogenase (NADP+)|nr:aldo/keto reductase [Candidatus Dormibacteraeota bacterium]